MLSSHSGIIGNNADQQSYGDIFDAILESTAKQLMSLPFEAREPVELGLKDLWNYLLAQESTRVSRYSGKSLVYFSCPENLAAKIEEFCEKHEINIEDTNIPRFLRYLSGDLSFKTFTGKLAHQLLICMLQTANYLLSPQLKAETFLQDMGKILSKFDKPFLQDNRLFPVDYYSEIFSIYDQLPEKHAEKQTEEKQQEISLRLVSNTPYFHFYNVFMELNKTYGPDGDYSKHYQGNPEFIRCRYPTIFTKRQAEFSGGCSLDILLQNSEHKPGDIHPGVYPAAKIPLYENRNDKFVVLGEGPYKHTFPVLLDRLEEQKVNVLIAVGPPEENSKEKYFNYMNLAQEVSVEEYLRHATTIAEIPEKFKDLKSAESLTIKYYRYVRPENERVFYIMHIPSWKDLGMPVLTDADKLMLACDAEYGGNRYYHCSAGVGRSVAVIMMRMTYELIFKNNLDFSQAIKEFEVILKRIKDVKPRAGEWWQLLLAIGVAEDMHKHMSALLAMKATDAKANDSSPSFRLIYQTSNTHLSTLLKGNLAFFKQFADRYLEENRHAHPTLQHEYDKRFGLVPCKK